MLTTNELIARMTPTALAETIHALSQMGNLNHNESATVQALQTALWANVGEYEAAELIAACE